MSKTTIPTAGLADDAVDNTKLDLTSNYAFTGTVTGVGGITEADIWRVNANVSGDADPVTGLERTDDAISGYIGTGMTQSSGIFTFPSTGVWLVNWSGVVYDSGTDDLQVNLIIKGTTDNSTYDEIGYGMTNLHHASQNPFHTQCFVDITNTSTHKVKFVVEGNNGELQSSTNTNVTSMMFIRLGDT